MKQKQLTAVGVACGVACALCVFAFMGSVQGKAAAERDEALARYGGEQVEVCVAARDIAAGERVDAGAVEMRLWIADLLPEEPCLSPSQVVGKTPATSILKGEVLSAQRFNRDRDALEVPQGMTAVSVPAKTVQAVGGSLQPGMHVDVYVAADASTTAILRDAAVLDTSAGSSGGSLVSDAAWITLAVPPENVEEVVAAASRYELYFVLPGESPEEGEGPGEDAGGDGSAAGEGAAANDAVAAGEQAVEAAAAADAGGEAGVAVEPEAEPAAEAAPAPMPATEAESYPEGGEDYE